MLTDAEKAQFARQILLPEIGWAGQDRLCATRFHVDPAADARAAEVARDYLERAGLAASSESATAVTVQVATTGEVARLAGDPALVECAAWLSGAFAAVEAIKASAQVGSPAELPAGFALREEGA